jgi:hypothetical protein
MLSARFVTAFALAASVGFVAANCGSSSDSSPSSGLGGVACPAGDNASKCTAEQNKAYSDCIIGKCDSALQMCAGAGYKSGNFSGACGPLFACQSKCACGDNACKAACGTGAAECTTCAFQTLLPCFASSNCMAPVCTGTADAGSTGGGASCTALSTCCAAIANPQVKAACQANVTGSMGNEQACAALLGGLRASMQCP